MKTMKSDMQSESQNVQHLCLIRACLPACLPVWVRECVCVMSYLGIYAKYFDIITMYNITLLIKYLHF